MTHLSPCLAPTLGTASALFLHGHDLLRHGTGSNEGQFHHSNRAATVAARLRIRKRPVTDDAGGHCVTPGAPLGPPGDAHARRERGRTDLTARTPRAEGELGDHEPAQYVRRPACAEAGLGEGGQECAAHGCEPLVGEHLDLGRVAGVGHKRGLSAEPPGPLEGGRGSEYAGCTVRSSVGTDPGQAPRVASFLGRIRPARGADHRGGRRPTVGGGPATTASRNGELSHPAPHTLTRISLSGHSLRRAARLENRLGVLAPTRVQIPLSADPLRLPLLAGCSSVLESRRSIRMAPLGTAGGSGGPPMECQRDHDAPAILDRPRRSTRRREPRSQHGQRRSRWTSSRGCCHWQLFAVRGGGSLPPLSGDLPRDRPGGATPGVASFLGSGRRRRLRHIRARLSTGAPGRFGPEGRRQPLRTSRPR